MAVGSPALEDAAMSALDCGEVRKILVRAPNWIGDAVMCTPALSMLRSGFPKAWIALLANSTVAELLAGHPCLDAIRVYDRKGIHRGVRGKWRLGKEIAGEGFDLAVLFQNAFEAALLSRLGKIPHRHGYAADGRRFLLTMPVPLPPESCHQVDYYLRMLEPLGIEVRRGSLCLVTTEEEGQQAGQRLKGWGIGLEDRVVGINPGATYGGAKRWPTERYAELADALIDAYGVKVLIFGGPAEARLGFAISEGMRRPATVLSGTLSVREMMAMIRRCSLFVTNDSGPMHVAAAFKVPIVAVFGPTDPEATSPVGDGIQLIRKDVVCAPCLLRECPIDHRCMRGISVGEVLEAARGPLSGLSPSKGLRQTAVFLDRDGTLNEEVGYLDSPDRLRLLPGAAEAVRLINQSNLKAVVLTNQSGVARGYYSEQGLEEIHRVLRQLLSREGARLDGIYYCPHHPEDECVCRKPRTGMIEAARRELALDLSGSYVIGDKLTDIELAHHVRAKGVLVLTGAGREELAKLQERSDPVRPAYVASDLVEAVSWIKQDMGSS